MQRFIVTKGSLLVPGTNRTIKRGMIVPDGFLDKTDIDSLVRTGRIATAESVMGQRAAVVTPPVAVTKGKWGLDPATLEGKSMEELLLSVLAVDEDFDTDQFETEGDVIDQLTQDWDERFGSIPAISSDSSDVAPVDSALPSGHGSIEDARKAAQGGN